MYGAVCTTCFAYLTIRREMTAAEKCNNNLCFIKTKHRYCNVIATLYADFPLQRSFFFKINSARFKPLSAGTRYFLFIKVK